MRLRRVLLLVVVVERLGVGVTRHYAVTSTGASTSTCSTGRFVSVRSRCSRSRRSQPERAPGNVDTMISSTRSSSIV